MSLGKIPIEARTPKELAKTLRQFAETTASFSQNWDNYEELVADILIQIQEYYASKRNATE